MRLEGFINYLLFLVLQFLFPTLFNGAMEELTSFCLSFGVQLWKGPGLHFFAFARVGAIHSGI